MQSKAVSAGRGVLYIALAKIYFIVVGFVIQVALPAILSRATNGAYQVVNSLVSPFNNVVVTGTVQAVAKHTAERPDQAGAVQRAGLRMHVGVGAVLALVFILGAPLTSRFFWDASKTEPLMLAGLIIGGYSFYAVFVGTANGMRWFHKQAALDMGFATLRGLGLVGMAAAGATVIGVVAGWVVAVVVILGIAAWWVRSASTHGALAFGLTRYFLQLAVYLLLFNLLMFLDVWLLKRSATMAFAATAPMSLADAWPGLAATGFQARPYELADVLVGYYASGQLLARLPYQLILAGTFVVFPLVSRSVFEGDIVATRRYVRTTLRYSLLFAAVLAAPMIANPEGILRILFGDDYARRGAPALRALAVGNIGFSLFSVAGTILNGAGKTRTSTLIAGGTLVLTCVLGLVAVTWSPAVRLIEFVALATCMAMMVGGLLSIIALWRQTGAGLPWVSAVRIFGVITACVVLGSWMPDGTRIQGMFGAVLTTGLCLVGLFVAREVGIDELRALRRKGASE